MLGKITQQTLSLITTKNNQISISPYSRNFRGTGHSHFTNDGSAYCKANDRKSSVLTTQPPSHTLYPARPTVHSVISDASHWRCWCSRPFWRYCRPVPTHSLHQPAVTPVSQSASFYWALMTFTKCH